MKKINNLIYCLLFGALSFTTACDPGASCGDPALVAIPGSDASAPELTWYVTQLSSTPSGPISAITPYTGSSINVSAKPTDEIKVYLVAKDEQSGIQEVSMSGGFGQTCNTPTGAIAASGIIPAVSQDLSFLTVCGMIEWKLTEIPINVGMSCGAGNTLTELGFAITGTAENNTGGTAMSTLNINVVP